MSSASSRVCCSSQSRLCSCCSRCSTFGLSSSCRAWMFACRSTMFWVRVSSICCFWRSASNSCCSSFCACRSSWPVRSASSPACCSSRSRFSSCCSRLATFGWSHCCRAWMFAIRPFVPWVRLFSNCCSCTCCSSCRVRSALWRAALSSPSSLCKAAKSSGRGSSCVMACLSRWRYARSASLPSSSACSSRSL